MTQPGSVARISIAPVKGLALVHPDVVEVSADGVVGDRRYALLDADGRLVNGTKHGPLVRVVPESTDEPETLVLWLPDGARVGGQVRLGAEAAAVFYGEPRRGRVVLGPYAEALSDLAGVALTLVRMEDGEGVDRAGDGAVSIQSAAALGALGEQAGLDRPVDGRRFRMTFTIDGVEPYAEDGWIGHEVRIGEAVVRPRGNVGRCSITTQDPDTGLKSLDTLHLIQRARGHLASTEPLPFGVHAEVVVPGRVSVGDPVSISG